MTVYDKLMKVMGDRNVEGYVDLIHENAEVIFHKSGDRFGKTEWASMVAGMMGNPKFVNDASRCIYENEDILVKTFKVEQVRKMLKNNQILNGLTLIALQWFFLEYYKN